MTFELKPGSLRSIPLKKRANCRLEYRAENVIDLESEAILSATICLGTDGNPQTLLASVLTARTHLEQSGCSREIEEVAAQGIPYE